jgi:hypothetical protein
VDEEGVEALAPSSPLDPASMGLRSVQDFDLNMGASDPIGGIIEVSSMSTLYSRWDLEKGGDR